jgi:hypothetical protein
LIAWFFERRPGKLEELRKVSAVEKIDAANLERLLKKASPQHGVGRGRRGESSIPPELRKSMAIRASAE